MLHHEFPNRFLTRSRSACWRFILADVFDEAFYGISLVYPIVIDRMAESFEFTFVIPVAEREGGDAEHRCGLLDGDYA